MTHETLMKAMDRNHEVQKSLYSLLHAAGGKLTGKAEAIPHIALLTGDRAFDKLLEEAEAIVVTL